MEVPTFSQAESDCVHVCLPLPSLKISALSPREYSNVPRPVLATVQIRGLYSMTMTAGKQANGGKKVPWTSSIRFRLPIPEDIESGQSYPNHDELSAEPSIYTLDIDDPWAKKSILSLDGGGVRSFSSLLILQELMGAVEEYERRINPEARSSADSPLVNCLPDKQPSRSASDPRSVSRYLPCHYFDYVSGTSTGGLIAILLGRLRMSVDEAIEEYKELSTKVFGQSASRWKRYLMNHDNIERGKGPKDPFDSIPPARLSSPQEQAEQFKSDRARCRTIVCSMKSNEDKNFQTPFLFRSYDRETSYTSRTPFERNPGDPNIFAISQVARATSAALSHFKSIHMFEARYYDGATNLNNPSWEVVREVSLLAKESHDTIDLLLSIGGGNAKGNNPRTRFGTGSLLQELTEISDIVHERVMFESKVQGFAYSRFDVKEGLQAVHMNEWRPKSSGETTLGRIESATKKYLKLEEVKSSLQWCAAYLVDKRMQRARTMRWERFATGAQYICPLVDDCPTPEAKFNTRNDLMDHLRLKHNQAPPDADHYQHIQRLLDQGRTNSE